MTGWRGGRGRATARTSRSARAALVLAAVAALLLGAPPVDAQVPFPGEVRQLVTFSFVPGGASDAISVFRESALPLYRADEDMLAFRGFSEVESSIPLDLVVVSSFRGMAGMDASNATLGQLGIGAFYGAVTPLIAGHTDQFVEMLLELGRGDPSEAARTALVWYRVTPGSERDFEAALAEVVVPWEVRRGVAAATGRFLLSDGWHYLRFVGLESLGDYQAYWTALRELSGYERLEALTAARREVLLSRVRALTVR